MTRRCCCSSLRRPTTPSSGPHGCTTPHPIVPLVPLASSQSLLLVFVLSLQVYYCDAVCCFQFAARGLPIIPRRTSSSMVEEPAVFVKTTSLFAVNEDPTVGGGTTASSSQTLGFLSNLDTHNNNNNITNVTGTVLYDDVQRYRNRAALAEGVLKEKVQELRLLQSKLQLLENVVLTLKEQMHQNMRMNASNLMVRTTISGVRPVSIMSKTTTKKYTQPAKPHQPRQRRIERDHAQLKSQLEQDMRTELQQQYQQVQTYNATLQSVQDHHERDRMQWADETREMKFRQATLEANAKALRQEILSLDETLETSQNDRIALQKRLNQQEEDARQFSKKEKQRQERLKAELEEAMAKIEQLQAALNEQAASTISQSEEERMESLEIASAAVKAAERRERAVQKLFDDSQEQLASMQRENDELRAKVAALQTTNNSSRVEQDHEIQNLQEQLKQERNQHEAQLRSISMRHEDTKKRPSLEDNQVKEESLIDTQGRNKRGLWSSFRKRIFRRRRGRQT